MIEANTRYPDSKNVGGDHHYANLSQRHGISFSSDLIENAIVNSISPVSAHSINLSPFTKNSETPRVGGLTALVSGAVIDDPEKVSANLDMA